MPGYVYLLSNPSMPGLLKIGHTTAFPEQRIRQLNTTGVPLSFVLEACFFVVAPEALEQAVHAALAQYRPAQNREFFQLSLSRTLELILPIVVQAVEKPVAEMSGSLTNSQSPNKELGESERHILQLLASAGSQHGMEQWRIESHTGLAELDFEVSLASLAVKKFIARARGTAGCGFTWIPTPKGIKFLADNNLIEEWMRHQ